MADEAAGTSHVVEPGEHLPAIAKQYGFRDYRAIWEHGANAALKQQRGLPTVLLAGDLLQIPPLTNTPVAKPADDSHRFSVRVLPLKLRVEISQRFRPTLAGLAAKLVAGPVKREAPLDGDGGMEVRIDPATSEARLEFDDRYPPDGGDIVLTREIELAVGALDPIDAPTGEYQRLRNLGYHTQSYDEVIADIGGDAIRSAIEEFQCDHGLAVDGILGPASRAKLETVHGC